MAHGREAAVLEARRAAKARHAEDLNDFHAACKTAWQVRAGPGEAPTGPGERAAEGADEWKAIPIHQLALTLSQANGDKADATASIVAGGDAAMSAVEFCVKNGIAAASQVLQLSLDIQKSAVSAGVKVPIVAPADQPDAPAVCFAAAAAEIEGSDDDGSAAAVLLVRAWIHGRASYPAANVYWYASKLCASRQIELNRGRHVRE